jgi:Iap family predicted aminopeptidase
MFAVGKIRAIAGCLFLVITAACNSSSISSSTERAEVFMQINDEVLHHSRAYESLKDITEKIGHRLTGTGNGKRAEEYVHGLLSSYGMKDMQYHEFEATSWSRESVRLTIGYADDRGKDEIIFPGKTSESVYFDCVSLAHSPVESHVNSRIIDLGNGLRKDFEASRDSIKGKIVLLNIGIYPKDTTIKNLHRSEKTALAIEYGATGAIFVNTVKGNILLTGTASVTGDLIPVPAVCISLEDGDSLRKMLRNKSLQPVWSDIMMKNKSEKIKARNIVATIKGNELPDEEIIVCGHLDSWDLATGAIDNGIGSFSVIEMARVFQKLSLHPKRTIRFILFMGEEQGLLGSKAYLRDRTKDRTIDKIRYVINIDMGGNTMGFNATGRSGMEKFIRDVNEEIGKIDTVFEKKYIDKVGLHSDHQSFMLEGIPVMGIESKLDPGVYKFYHSNKDNFSLVNKKHLDNCVRFTAMMVYALADTETIEAKRLSSEETKAFFEKAKLKEELVLGKEWKW